MALLLLLYYFSNLHPATHSADMGNQWVKKIRNSPISMQTKICGVVVRLSDKLN